MTVARAVILRMLASLVVLLASVLSAYGQRGVQAPATPRTNAPIDMTGNWVSVVTEDWRWRMLTPPKGDYASLPLNAQGRAAADAWDPSKAASDGCKPYGAAALLRMPGRLRIAWANDSTLKIETDSGMQTRLLQFDRSARPAAASSWQGHTVAEWEFSGARGAPAAGGARGGAARAGSLKAVTTNLRAGYLRPNGVPYSENAVVTEYFDRLTTAGSEWLTVITIVDDPAYLTQSFITSTHFKREANASKWSPMPCE